MARRIDEIEFPQVCVRDENGKILLADPYDERLKMLDSGLRSLTPIERNVLHLYYGLEGQEKPNLKKVAEAVGYTPQGVSAAIRRALSKLTSMGFNPLEKSLTTQ